MTTGATAGHGGGGGRVGGHGGGGGGHFAVGGGHYGGGSGRGHGRGLGAGVVGIGSGVYGYAGAITAVPLTAPPIAAPITVGNSVHRSAARRARVGCDALAGLNEARFSQVRLASGCSTSSTNSRTPSGPMTRAGIFTRRRCTAAPIMTCRTSCVGSPPISGCTMSIISAAVSRITDCHECYGITQSLLPSGGLRCSRACSACAWFFGTKRSGASFHFARCIFSGR